jgi:hypothetical protein
MLFFHYCAYTRHPTQAGYRCLKIKLEQVKREKAFHITTASRVRAGTRKTGKK